MTYFELRPAINDDKAVEIQVTEEFLDKYNVCTSGSYGVLPSRLLELSYANYLRFVEIYLAPLFMEKDINI